MEATKKGAYSITQVSRFIAGAGWDRSQFDSLKIALDNSPELINERLPDKKLGLGYTVLHMVAIHPNNEVLDLLLSKGAGVNFFAWVMSDGERKTPVELAGGEQTPFGRLMQQKEAEFRAANPKFKPIPKPPQPSTSGPSRWFLA